MSNKLSLFAFVFAAAALALSLAGPSALSEKSETAYERVLRTRTLRCGYMLWPTIMEREPNTGKFGGFFVDITEAIAESLGIKVEWAQEIAIGTQVETLRSGKVDAICDDATLQTEPTLQVAYAEPVIFFPIFAFVRTDDTRFTDQNDRINQPDVRVSVIDGDLSHEIVRKLYTKATPVALPQLAEANQMMMDVVTNKADVMLTNGFAFKAYLESNPDKLRKLSNEPIMSSSASLSVLRSEVALQDMLSQAIKNLRIRGIEARIHEKYGFGTKHAIFPALMPYDSKLKQP